jgi:glyoxylase I family protein
MRATYKHTNLIARDWQKLAAFYEKVFGCIRIPPERNLSGSWLATGTGVTDAKLSGVQLRLPGCGETGPTLELFQYAANEQKPAPAANREGWGHIAFEVDDVKAAMKEVLEHGGQKVGDVTSFEVKEKGTMTFVYIADPEGNIIELQNLSA